MTEGKGSSSVNTWNIKEAFDAHQQLVKRVAIKQEITTLKTENVGLKTQVSELEKEKEEARLKSETSHSTGFKNRRGLDAYKEDLLDNHHSHVVIVADLDGLKKINDDKENGGHDKGDEYIQSFVEFANKFFREEDLKFRIGGDEFLFIIENTSWDENLQEKLAKRLVENLAIFNQDRELKLSFTFGIDEAKFRNAVSNEDKLKELNDAIKRADQKETIAKDIKHEQDKALQQT